MESRRWRTLFRSRAALSKSQLPEEAPAVVKAVPPPPKSAPGTTTLNEESGEPEILGLQTTVLFGGPKKQYGTRQKKVKRKVKIMKGQLVAELDLDSEEDYADDLTQYLPKHLGGVASKKPADLPAELKKLSPAEERMLISFLTEKSEVLGCTSQGSWLPGVHD